MKKTKCIKCDRLISNNNISKHENSCTGIKILKKLICQFCGRNFTTKTGNSNHEIQCDSNPNRIFRKTNSSWNKNLTKENDVRIQEHAKKLSEKYLSGELKVKGFYSYEYRQSEQYKLNCAKGGGFKEGSGRGKKTYYHNIEGEEFLLRSSYELKVAKYLNSLNILWCQPKYIQYNLNNKIFKYYGDFYLPYYNIIIETKNEYLLSIQQDKMNAVRIESNCPIVILTNKDMEDLDCSLKDILVSPNGEGLD